MAEFTMEELKQKAEQYNGLKTTPNELRRLADKIEKALDSDNPKNMMMSKS